MPPIRHGSRFVAKAAGYPAEPYGRTKANKKKATKPIFKKLHISMAGTFITPVRSIGHNETTTIPYDKVKGWITAHAGEVTDEVEDDTTHLICSIAEYKKNSAQVEKAKALKTQCKIIVIDWIYDCLWGLPDEGWVKKLKPANNYLVKDAIQRINNASKVKNKAEDDFQAGVEACKDLANSRLHHVYLDNDAFQYKIELTRVSTIGPVTTERYTLYLFESHAKPSTYMFGATYNKRVAKHNFKTAYFRTHCVPRIFAVAFTAFKKFFKDKTGGIDWDERLERIRKPDTVVVIGGVETEKTVFRYTPPKVGMPVGELPWGYVRPELREQAERRWEAELFGGEGDGDDDFDEMRRARTEVVGDMDTQTETETATDASSSMTTTTEKDDDTIRSSELERNVADFGADLEKSEGFI